MLPADAPSATDLPDRLRLGTRDLHGAAERTALMATLIGGRIERGPYVLLLRNLHAVYGALEPALSAAAATAQAGWACFARPVLHRSAALAADLTHLHGPHWREDLPLGQAAAAYSQRLQQLAAEADPALAAHAYVRYLGDLHGGQVLRRRVGQALGLDGEAGLCFYDFGPAEVVQALRLEFRAALGQLALTPQEVGRVVDEARWGFEQHIRLFDELASAPA
jgi:heme oxygenase (biliverdin-producing, ferredoxin)